MHTKNNVKNDSIFYQIRTIPNFQKTPFLNVRDKETKKQFSLKPVKAWENIDQVFAVVRLIEHVGNQDWNYQMPILDQLEFLDNPNSEDIYVIQDLFKVK